MATITNIGIFPTTLEIRENILKELAPGESVDILDKYIQCSHIQNGIENGWIKITSNLGSIRASYDSLGVFSGITNTNGDLLPVAKSVSPYEKFIPSGLSWITDSIPGIDLYAVGFSAKPTIFFDPSAVSSQGLGTFNNPFTTQAQLQAVCSGDMSGQVLGFKRGTTLRVTGVNGLELDCYASAAAPFIMCPYGDSGSLPVISAGIPQTSWVNHSGNVYKVTGITKNTDVFQDTRRLFKKTTLSGITSEGNSFWDSGTNTLYAWFYESADPNKVVVETQGSDFALSLRYTNTNQTGNIHVVGLDCCKGRNISLRITYPTINAAITSVAGLWIIGCKSGQAGFDASGLTTASDAMLLYGVSDTIRATNSMMIGNEGYDSLNNAFEISNTDGLIHDGNYGHDVGGNSILELWSSCSNTIVRNNYGIRSNGVGRIFANYHAGGIWATVFNDVTGGTNRSHASFQGNRYEFNIIAESQGQHIQIDGGTNNKVYHNTLYNSPETPTNRMLNLFANCPIAGTVSADVSNNLLVCGNTSTRILIDIVQGTVTATDIGTMAVVSTVTGDNNHYYAWSTPTAQLRVRNAAGPVLSGQSGLAAYKVLTAPFDANAVANWTTTPSLISTTYRPLGTTLTGGKTGLTFKRYKDGGAYINSSVAVGALSK